jgi:hypothetical protein
MRENNEAAALTLPLLYDRLAASFTLEIIVDKKLALYWRAIQPSLLPGFKQEIGAQTPQHGRLLVVIDWLEIEKCHAQFQSISSKPWKKSPKKKIKQESPRKVRKGQLSLPFS